MATAKAPLSDAVPIEQNTKQLSIDNNPPADISVAIPPANSPATIIPTVAIIEFNIIYNLNGGTNHPTNPPKYNMANLPLNITDPTNVDYDFAGWTVEYPDGTTANSQFNYSIPEYTIGDIILTATWKTNTTTEYSINYVLNNSTLPIDAPISYYVDDLPVAIGDPVRDGYAFSGWHVVFANGTVVDVSPGFCIPEGTTGDLVLFAHWVPVSVVYGITYVLSGGVNAEGNPLFYVVDDLPVAIGDPVRDGYAFSGWHILFANGTVVDVPPSFNIAKGTIGIIALIATWQLIDETTVTYNKVSAEFNSYCDATTGQFRRDLFDGYTAESVSEAEHIMNVTAQTYIYLLTLYGRSNIGHFTSDDDAAIIKVATHMLMQAIIDMKTVLKIDMTTYNALYAEFSSYFTATGQFNREMLDGYTVESILEAELIMNDAKQTYISLLALHGQLDTGYFTATNDITAIKEATYIFTHAIADMTTALKPIVTPDLLIDTHDMGNHIFVWFSHPVETTKITVLVDGNPAKFDGVLLNGAKTWIPGLGYVDAYSYIDISKVTNWTLIMFTITEESYVIEFGFENDLYVPSVE